MERILKEKNDLLEQLSGKHNQALTETEKLII